MEYNPGRKLSLIFFIFTFANMPLLSNARNFPAQTLPTNVGFPFPLVPGESAALLLNGGLIINRIPFTHTVESEVHSLLWGHRNSDNDL